MSDHPEKLGKYPIEGVLGEGGMGVVYRGFHPRLKKSVAIKVIRANLMQGRTGRELRRRFEREAEAEGRLGIHANIVAIHDFQEDETGNPFFVMELVDGQSLKEYLSRGMHFNLETSLSILSQVLTGLQHSHDKGVIHRDIKPANILLLEDDSIKIADFGIARLDESEYTQTGMVIGSPQYSSPEQEQGKKIDHRSDLYSAGLVFYELLTGEKPFARNLEGTDRRSLGDAHFSKLESYEAQERSILKDVLQRALAEDPGQRYQSASEFLKDLWPVMRKRDVGDETATKWPQVAGGLAILMVVVAILTGLSVLDFDLSELGGKRQQAEVVLSLDQRSKLERNLKVGEIHLKVGRLIMPAGSNAYHAYKMALELDPYNRAALKGMETVQERVVQQVSEQQAGGDLAGARQQLAHARSLFPENDELGELAQDMGL